MRITITNDEGEVYVALTDVTIPALGARHATAADEEGDVDTVWSFIEQAARWEEANR